MKNVLILDVETSTKQKGNPFTLSNELVCVGLKKGDYNFPYIEYRNEYDSFDIDFIQEVIDESDLIITFNGKFDLHWVRRIGIDISKIKVWDCQLAEFLLSNQEWKYPSLDGCAEKYGLNKKLDIVKLEYWDKGLDTSEVPREVLSDYLAQDLNLTQQVYEKQLEIFKTDPRFNLFRLQCADLLVLEDMEYNGIKFETGKALDKAGEIKNELEEIKEKFKEHIGDIPFNPSSGDHVSAALYGGKILEEIRIPIGVFKTGAKEGQLRYKVVEKVYELPRMCEPIKGTETEKSKKKDPENPSIWETNETVLRKLKLNRKAKEFVSLLRRYSELEKLSGTYLIGYSDLIKEMDWPTDMLHGTLNQCVVITGRLSSSKPNMQNADPTTKVFMESRYD